MNANKPMPDNNHYYFKREWNETTANELTDSWGHSTFYFETDDQHVVVRQMQIFKNGNTLKYDTEYIDDKFGGLSEAPIDIEDFAEYSITSHEFNQVWDTSYYNRFPEIVCTSDVLWGQPRLEGRRLAISDIVSLINVYHEDIFHTLKDFELTLQQARQAIHYCKSLKCKNDKPEKFCHNCLLRINQFNLEIDKSDTEQPYWLLAERLYEKHFK